MMIADSVGTRRFSGRKIFCSRQLYESKIFLFYGKTLIHDKLFLLS